MLLKTGTGGATLASEDPLYPSAESPNRSPSKAAFGETAVVGGRRDDVRLAFLAVVEGGGGKNPLVVAGTGDWRDEDDALDLNDPPVRLGDNTPPAVGVPLLDSDFPIAAVEADDVVGPLRKSKLRVFGVSGLADED